MNYQTVTPDYFRTMGTRVLRGRAFAETDTPTAPPVAIVSESLARRLWPGQDAVGKHLLGPGPRRDARGELVWATVVGVVEDVRYRGLTDVRLDLYKPYLEQTERVKHLMVRADDDPLALIAAIRAAARGLDPTSLVEGATTMEEIVGTAVAPWRFSATTLGVLSAIALLLAALGIYATVSQSVVERRREIAVRMALGGLRRDIIRLIFGEGMLVTTAGVLVGLTAAVVVGRAVTRLLFGVSPIDAATFAAMTTLLVIVGALALLVPTWRATAVDPATVLRQEP